jgi:hypothetical protein
MLSLCPASLQYTVKYLFRARTLWFAMIGWKHVTLYGANAGFSLDDTAAYTFVGETTILLRTVDAACHDQLTSYTCSRRIENCAHSVIIMHVAIQRASFLSFFVD